MADKEKRKVCGCGETRSAGTVKCPKCGTYTVNEGTWERG